MCLCVWMREELPPSPFLELKYMLMKPFKHFLQAFFYRAVTEDTYV